MKIILLLTITNIFLFGNIFDQYNLYNAQVEYKNNNYNKSLKYYKKIEDKTDKIYYNIGNILYKQKLYQKAITSYKKINSTNLNYKKLHNIANCYIQLNKIDLAIVFYKSALKFKSDKDTKYNLILALDIQEKIAILKKEKIKLARIKANIKARDGNRQIDMFKDGDKKEKLTSGIIKDIIIKSNNISMIKSKQINKNIEFVKKIDINGTKDNKNIKHQLSRLEENKWNKSLSNKTINTLLIPLENKGTKNATYPW